MSTCTRVKICGITRIEDALHAAQQGVDALGLVFHRPSSRFIGIEDACAICRALPPFITRVALFLDEDADWVAQVVHQVRPDCLQFHGGETAEFCDAWMTPYLKSIPMGSGVDAHEYARSYPGAQGFLLDSNIAGRLGGSGDTFDWSKIPSSFEAPLVLAGGLTPTNVAEAIDRVKPWGVDVSTGVETSRGIKGADLIDRFMHEVKRGDGHEAC